MRLMLKAETRLHAAAAPSGRQAPAPPARNNAARPRPPLPLAWLPRREAEVAQILDARGEASAADICETLGDAISNAAVRSMLRRLELKGVVRRRKQGRKFLYILARSAPGESLIALRELIDSHFDGSSMKAAMTLLGMVETRDPAQADAVAQLSDLLRQVDLD